MSANTTREGGLEPGWERRRPDGEVESREVERRETGLRASSVIRDEAGLEEGVDQLNDVVKQIKKKRVYWLNQNKPGTKR